MKAPQLLLQRSQVRKGTNYLRRLTKRSPVGSISAAIEYRRRLTPNGGNLIRTARYFDHKIFDKTESIAASVIPVGCFTLSPNFGAMTPRTQKITCARLALLGAARDGNGMVDGQSVAIYNDLLDDQSDDLLSLNNFQCLCRLLQGSQEIFPSKHLAVSVGVSPRPAKRLLPVPSLWWIFWPRSAWTRSIASLRRWMSGCAEHPLARWRGRWQNSPSSTKTPPGDDGARAGGRPRSRTCAPFSLPLGERHTRRAARFLKTLNPTTSDSDARLRRALAAGLPVVETALTILSKRGRAENARSTRTRKAPKPGR